MNDDLRERVADYRSVMSVIGKMLEEGIITYAEYVQIDTIMAVKYIGDPYTVFR